MAKVEVKHKENPKLRQRKLADGRNSLYLEYYLGYNRIIDEQTGKVSIKHIRNKENLNLYLTPARTPSERQKNSETLSLANKIRYEREQELLEDRKGYRLKKGYSVNFLDYFNSYIDKYTKKDIRNIRGSLERFKSFLAEHYPALKDYITPNNIDKDMMIAFVDYLKQHSKGVGAWSYYQRFKKVVNHATEHGIFKKSPCTGVSCKTDDTSLRKDVLSVEEMQQLITTTYNGQSDQIRRAFIFCLYTGIRFCDVKCLRYSNVDFSNKLLRFEQDKTKGHSGQSIVTIPMKEDLLFLIGEPPKNEEGQPDTNALLFLLPSHNACLKSLSHWTTRAGITKHITWHCARHSFAVNILNNGANIKTVSSLLGHSSLKHTEKYTRAVDELKKEAVDSLPGLIH
ncbi:MAG: site-specific integrase [Bacteroidales bacterium]